MTGDRFIEPPTNVVDVSMDRRHMVITGPLGQRSELRSRRPEGFTQEDIDRALTYRFSATMVRGQVNRAWRHEVAGWAIYLHVGTGPPTWWLPRVKLGVGEAMIGWLRAMTAIKVTRSKS